MEQLIAAAQLRIEATAESLLNDNGVDHDVARELAKDIIEAIIDLVDCDECMKIFLV